MTWPEDTPDSPVVDLGHEQMELLWISRNLLVYPYGNY
jgi:hypothetical protein